MKFTMLLPPKYDARKWTLAKQIGVNYAITKAMPSLSGKPAPYDLAALRAIQEDFARAGESERISEKKLWENLLYFLDAVLPVAEENGIEMALHPDDPPISPLKGVGRILTNAAAFDAILKKYPSPSNGITFCQATFRTMGEDLKQIARPWLENKRVFFLHLRDIAGDKYHFRETFHDNGPTPMAEMMQFYHACGFDGPLRPDHAPAMYGETQ